MTMAVAISPGILILLFYIQNISAQQCLNNVGFESSSGLLQQNCQKTSGFNQNGVNLNSPQQNSIQRVSYQQQPNVQQTSITQLASNQPSNYQQGIQQSVNSKCNSHKQLNQELAANILSALYNIKPSNQNQRDSRNIAKGNIPPQINIEQLPPTNNHPSPVLASTRNIQNNQPAVSNSYSEYSQTPSFTFQFVPANNNPVQTSQQVFALPVHKVNANDPNQSYSIQNQPLPNIAPNQQRKSMQSSIVMYPSTQTSSAQSQPIVLALQSPVSSIQNQPIVTGQTSQGLPVIYTAKTQSTSSQNIQTPDMLGQMQSANANPTDKQSVLSYMLSQMQNKQGSGSALASILPAVLNTKSEKSSSMKTLLPIILSILNDRKSCCGCPHCGCNNGNINDQTIAEPLISTGYSNQVHYGQQNSMDSMQKNNDNVDTNVSSVNDSKKDKTQDVKDYKINKEASEEEEDEDENESDEEYEDE